MRVAVRALLAGGGAGLVLTAAMLALRLIITAPTFPERVADKVLLLVPQALFSAGIDRFGFAAKPLLFVGIIAAQIALAALGGLIYGGLAFLLAGSLDLTNPAVGGATGLLLAIGGDFALLPALGLRSPLSAVGGATTVDALAMTALPGLAYGLALVLLLRLLTPPRPQRIAATGAIGVERSRIARRAIVALALPTLGALITAGALRRLLAGSPATATPGPMAQLPALETPTPASAATPPTISPSPPPLSAPTATGTPPPPAATSPAVPTSGTPLPAAGVIAGGLPGGTAIVAPTTAPAPTAAPIFTSPTPAAAAAPTIPPATPTIPARVAPRITPNEQFYLISKNLLDPILSAERWELTIGGLVEKQRTLRHADLLALPPTQLPATLECISNEPGGDLIGTAIWTGVPLQALLSDVQPGVGATHVVFVCADDYVERLTLAQALDPATLLVYAMNGAPLTARHGSPARLIAAGRYGMKNPKWVTRIEIVDNATPSYWSQRGWDPDAPVQVFSRVDAPAQSVGLGPVAVGGVAYAGNRGIARVEISADGGATWLLAELEPALSPVTWVRWVARWTPPGPGSYTLAARAFEADGTPQVATTRTLNARGSTGLGRRDVTVAP